MTKTMKMFHEEHKMIMGKKIETEISAQLILKAIVKIAFDHEDELDDELEKMKDIISSVGQVI